MSNSERALTDAAPDIDRDEDETPESALTDFIESETDLPEPEDYDFAAMVAGVTPNRERVRIRPRSDLYSVLQEIGERWSSLEGQEVPEDVAAELEAEWDAVYAEYSKTFVVVIEGRSSDWQRDFHRELKKRGIDPTRKKMDEEQRAKHVRRQINAQLAAQIIFPRTGVTESAIEALAAANEVEMNKLYMALTRVNTRPSGDAAFLRGR